MILKLEVFGYLASILIGLLLGLLGGGGSILSIPILVYLFHVDAVLAAAYSLFIVGSTSFVGAVTNYIKGWVNVQTALLFGISSISTVFLTRKFIIPAIPEHLISIGRFTINSSLLTMILFAVLMLMASFSMISSSNKPVEINGPRRKHKLPPLLGYGILVGLVTGLLGAGGGFLIIPTLVLLVGLPMKEAIGTSLMIIAMNSLLGFTGDLGHTAMDWQLLFILTGIAIAGIFIGGSIGKKIHGTKLKKGFGWFVLVMGIFILARELLMK